MVTSASPSSSGQVAAFAWETAWFSKEGRAATVDPVRQARGWRYITLQIADIDTVHDDLCNRGVREGFAPITLKRALE